MNPWQVAKQLRFLLRSRTWDGTGERIFGDVRITAGPSDRGVQSLRVPFAMIRVLEAEADEEDPGILTQAYEIVLIQALAGDDMGENVLIGGNRSAGASSSLGRGLLEIEEEMLNVVREMNESGSGVKIIARSRGAVEVAEVETLGYVASRSYRILAETTDRRFYHPPTGLKAAAAAPNVTLSWSLPPNRYDRRQIILRRSAGSTPPASPTDGVGIALPGDLAVGVTDTPGAGTWSYAVFCGYDETGSGTNERFSGPDTATVTV